MTSRLIAPLINGVSVYDAAKNGGYANEVGRNRNSTFAV